MGEVKLIARSDGGVGVPPGVGVAPGVGVGIGVTAVPLKSAPVTLVVVTVTVREAGVKAKPGLLAVMV